MALHLHDGQIDHLAEDADVLTMGITPSGSGDLHAGHYVTLLNLFRTLSSHETPLARIFIDDREFQNQQPPQIPSEDVIRNLEQTIQLFLSYAASFLHDESLPSRVQIQRFSDFFYETGRETAFLGMDLLRLIRRYHDAIKRIYHDAPFIYKKPTKPICHSCGYGPRQIKHTRDTESGFFGECDYEECDELGNPYEVDVARGDTYWSIYYTLLGLRDVLLSDGERGVVHVYGGDYGMPWNQGASKAERIHGLVHEVLQDRARKGHVNYYVGPLIVGNGGGKLSKSHGDRLSSVDCGRLEEVLNRRTPIVNWDEATL